MVRRVLPAALARACVAADAAHGGAEASGRGRADAIVLLAADDGRPRNWELTGASGKLPLRERPTAHARALARFASGMVFDNQGCERAGAKVWCDVQQFGGGPGGYVPAAVARPAVSSDGRVATGSDDSALCAGQCKFDATGLIGCAQRPGQPLGRCDFGVPRAGGGYATVVVTRPDGRTRAISFRMGRAIGADSSQADGYPELRAAKENDLHLIRVGGERYEIPDAVVLCG